MKPREGVSKDKFSPSKIHHYSNNNQTGKAHNFSGLINLKSNTNLEYEPKNNTRERFSEVIDASESNLKRL